MLILIAKILMRKWFPIHKLFKKMCLTGSIFLCVLTHFGTTVHVCRSVTTFFSRQFLSITAPAQPTRLMPGSVSGIRIFQYANLNEYLMASQVSIEWWYTSKVRMISWMSKKTRPDTWPSVAHGWAGAVMLKNWRKSYFYESVTDGPTNGHSDL